MVLVLHLLICEEDVPGPQRLILCWFLVFWSNQSPILGGVELLLISSAFGIRLSGFELCLPLSCESFGKLLGLSDSSFFISKIWYLAPAGKLCVL
jgi:hypothetical protein